MYADINKHTGANTEPLEQLHQSIGDILTTPLSTRLMRRDYGSELFDLVDAAHNENNRVRLYAAVATALTNEEPRLQLSRVVLNSSEKANQAIFEIEGFALLDGQRYELKGMRITI